ncbi:MAG TPA: NfeD family protein, partial [Actinomycetota bacterium]
PGGLNAPVRRITEAVLSSKVPVVAWVSPSGARAASAGVFVTLAANVVAMAPGATLGPAHPANLARADLVAATSPGSGTSNETDALLRSVAEARGRDVEAADRLARGPQALTTEAAMAGHLADFVAGSPATLLGKLDGRTVEVGGQTVTLATARYELRFHKMSVMERLLHTALRPEIAYFLLLFGLFGLIFELYNPGVGAAGLTGGICLAFSLYALSVLPTSWAGVALLVAAVALFLVEMHEAGLGIFTAAGLAAFAGGSVMLFSGADPALRIPWTAIAAGVACMLLFFISVMTAAIRSRASVPAAGSERMTGLVGEARTDIAPEGQVFAKGTLWKARTAGMAIPEGAKVTILGMSGLLLIVEQAEAVAAPE